MLTGCEINNDTIATLNPVQRIVYGASPQMLSTRGSVFRITRGSPVLGLIAPTRAEAGCINYDLHVSEEDARQFVFYENWMSESHLEAHANSAHLRAFRKMADEILDGPVEITKWRML